MAKNWFMYSNFVDWLKTSIPGIILLGALGSILALPLMRLLKIGLQRILTLVERFLLLNYRPYTITRLLTKRYLDEGAWVKLLAWLLFCICDWVFTSTLVVAFCGVTVYRFAVSGVTLSIASYTLVFFSSLACLLWFRSTVVLAGIHSLVLGEDYRQMKSLKGDIHVLTFLAEAVDGPVSAKSTRAAHKAAETITTTITTAMTHWAEHVVTAQPSADQMQKMKESYEKYQIALKKLIEVGIEWTKADKTGDSARAAESNFNTALNEVGLVAGDFLWLMEKQGVDAGPMAIAIRSLSRGQRQSYTEQKS